MCISVFFQYLTKLCGIPRQNEDTPDKQSIYSRATARTLTAEIRQHPAYQTYCMETVWTPIDTLFQCPNRFRDFKKRLGYPKVFAFY